MQCYRESSNHRGQKRKEKDLQKQKNTLHGGRLWSMMSLAQRCLAAGVGEAGRVAGATWPAEGRLCPLVVLVEPTLRLWNHSCGPEGPQTLFSLTVQNQECVHRQEPRPGGLWGHSSMALRRRSGPGRGRGGDPLGSRALELEIFVLWATGAAVLPELPLCVEPRASLSGGGAVCRHSHRPHIPGLLPPCCLPG